MKVARFAGTACLVNLENESVAMFRRVVERAGAPTPLIVAHADVVALRKISPSLIVCDIDDLETDPSEWLRHARFVLPTCIIVVFTRTNTESWGRACHSSGANGVLSKTSNRAELVSGIRSSIRSGCFTDPHLAA